MKLLVRNLARFTTEKQLLALFESHGKVLYCTLIKDKASGKSKGFGFVEMPKPGEAKAAMKAINGTDIDGNRVRVKKTDDDPNISKNEDSVKSESVDTDKTPGATENSVEKAKTPEPKIKQSKSVWPQS